MISAFRRADTFRGDAAVTTWLHRIVVNACLDRLRRQKVRAADPLPDDLEEHAARGDVTPGPRPPRTPGPESSVVAGERRRRVLAALEELPPDQKAALVLVDLEGYPVAEAAAILEVPPGTGEEPLLPWPGPARRAAGRPGRPTRPAPRRRRNRRRPLRPIEDPPDPTGARPQPHAPGTTTTDPRPGGEPMNAESDEPPRSGRGARVRALLADLGSARRRAAPVGGRRAARRHPGRAGGGARGPSRRLPPRSARRPGGPRDTV